MDFENQQMLEHFFNARQTPKLLESRILTSEELVGFIQRSELDESFCIDLLGQMILHKRANLGTLVGILKNHFPRASNQLQACSDAILVACHANLVDYDAEREQFVLCFDVDQATHDLIRQYQYLPPMIVPPLQLNPQTNRGGGYLTVRTDSLLLKDNHHLGDVCVDSLEKFNNIPLAINIELVKSIRNSWKNLDKPKNGESFEDYRKRTKAFEKYEKDSFFTIALINEIGNRFWLTHKVDKRGRTYVQGYHINPQGNCWNKACVELADPEITKMT